MIYFFLISFFIFAIIDYIYLYIFFDSKIFMNASGSKLKYLISKNSDKEKFYIKLNKVFDIKNLKYFICLILFLLIMVLLNYLLFHNLLISNFIVINLGYKKIDIISAFKEYWVHFIKLYYFAYIIFLIILFKKFISKVILNMKIENSDTDNTCLKNEEDNDRVYVGKCKNEDVYINKIELYKNLLITGSIGTGKTTGAINKFCRYMIKNNIPGLIVDIKGNYVDTVNNYLLNNEKYDVIIISEESKVSYNPIKNDIRSLEMANRLRRVIELISPSNSSDTYWLDKVENVLFNMIVLIKYYNSNRLDLNEIHKLVTDEEYLKEVINKVKTETVLYLKDKKSAHEINSVIMFFSKEYFNLDKRVESIIKSEITRLTIPVVTEYDICNKFGINQKDDVKICFNSKKTKLIILSINMSKNFLLAKILATFVKLEFQSTVLENITSPIETFCICDEYQEFANTQDSHFLSLSREAKCMNIYSMQSYSSLINTLKDEKASKVIIQNMVNKIWFRNDDNYTAEEIVKQIGKEKKIFKTTAISEGAAESKKSIFSGLKNKKSNVSETISYIENNDYIFNSNVITRELETFEALTLFGEDGKMSNVRKVKFKRSD